MPADLRPDLEAILLQLTKLNNTAEQILAKVSAVIHVRVVNPNAPPQFTGPSEITDGVVGQTRALTGFDPDGDTIAWSMDAHALATISPAGVLTLNQAGEGDITVYMDDGKP